VAKDDSKPPRKPRKPYPLKHLAPIKYRQREFFVADILDAALKDDMPSMEHPLFALKAGDMRVREYERNGVKVTIKPGHDGCATIHDKDLWIYCISQLIESMNRGREDVSRIVRFTAHDFLVTTNRGTGGRAYKLLGEMLERLNGTRIETNIKTDAQSERGWFGFIDYAKVIERNPDDNRMVAIEIGLPEWLWRSVKARHVLTLSPDYFRLRRPLDRRVYELARKHCGHQARWKVSLKTLHKKSGSTAAVREFRQAIKALSDNAELPDYRVQYNNEDDTVTFYLKGDAGIVAAAMDAADALKRKLGAA